MTTLVPKNINNQPNPVLQYVPEALRVERPHRFVPSLRAGYFYVRDRRYVLFAKKASGYLEDMTWYNWTTQDQVLEGTERVWVRGVEVTNSGQYRFKNGRLQVNGGSLSHPGILMEQVNYDVSFIDPIDHGGILNQEDEVRIEYSYHDSVIGARAGLLIEDGVNGIVSGIVLESKNMGSGANEIQITINASGGVGAGAEVTTTDGITFEIDWEASATVQDVLDALQGFDAFTADPDGTGNPATDTFADLLTGAGITPPDTLPFTGGADWGFVQQTNTEIFKLKDADILYRLPIEPKNNLPVVMTDDSIQRWDRRDISPEFTVAQDGTVEFNVPRNYISDPDFTSGLDLWLTSGATAVATSSPSYTKPKSYSGSQFIHLSDDQDNLGQFVRAFDKDEQLLCVVARGGAGNFLRMEVEFFDINWNSLGNEVVVRETGDDWEKHTFSFGPDDRLRQYDAQPPAESYHALVTLRPDTGSVDIDVDYVFWGTTPLTPDMWHPHGRVTVEYDISDKPNYVHDTLITHHIDGTPLANIIPLETCNLHGVSVSDPEGFIYFYEYDETSDFQLGLGGINSPVESDTSTLDGTIDLWSIGLTSVPSSDGGWYVLGNYEEVSGSGDYIHVTKIDRDGVLDPEFNLLRFNGTVFGMDYDIENDILYLGGDFTEVSESAGSTIIPRVRLCAVSGTTGNILPFAPEANSTVAAIKIQRSTGLLIVGGQFTEINSTSRLSLCALNTDGTLHGWDPQMDDRVRSVDVWGYIVFAGGNFDSAFGTTRNRLAAWDIRTGDLTDLNPQMNGDVWHVSVYEDTLYVAGEFTEVDPGVDRNRVAAFDIRDESVLGWDPDANDIVYTVHRNQDYIYIGGDFTEVGGEPRVRTALLGTDGTLSPWRADATAAVFAEVRSIDTQDGRLLILGRFDEIAGDERSRLAIMQHFDYSPIEGRRWLPYAKTDGLGKLSHVASLRYNATPWVREISEVSPPPIPTRLRMLSTYGVGRNALQHTTTDVIPHGSNVIPGVPNAFDVIGKGDYVYFPDKIHPTRNSYMVEEVLSNDDIILRDNLPVEVPIGTDVEVEYRQMLGFADQERVIRLRLTDQLGAPVGQHEIKVWVQDPSVIEVDWNSRTDQNGETAFLVRFLKTGEANIEFSGSDSVRVRAKVEELPSAVPLIDSALGPNVCDDDYDNTVADW
jgi:hypothetical protein